MNYNRLVLAFLLLAGSMAVSAQHVRVQKSTIDCGEVIYKHPVTAVFQLSNPTKHSIKIEKVRTGCDCVAASYPEERIDKWKRFEVSTVYNATLLGHFRTPVEIYVQGDVHPVTLWMQGVVVRDTIRSFDGKYPYKVGKLKVDKNEVEFDVHKGDRQVQKIYIFNPTQDIVQPVMMHLPDYLSSICSPSKLSPGHAGVALLTLNSHRLHDFGLTQTSVYLGTSLGDQVSPDKEIIISTVLLPSEDHPSGRISALSPKMYLSSRKLDLGSFGSKEELKGKIRIINKGKQILEIRSLQMFSLGLKVSLNKTKIEPGKSAVLKIIAIKSGLQKSKSKPRILMITNDPVREEVEIPIFVKK